MQANTGSRPGVATRARRLARRYGIGYAKAGVAVFLAACVAVFVACSVGGAYGGGTTIERSAASEGVVEEGSAGDARTSGQEGSLKTTETVLVVHVDGAVVTPGVYCVADGARVNDAVLAAGGLAEGADTSATNLAAPLADGAKVHVPTTEELSASSSAAPSGEAGGGSGASSSGSSMGIVNLNTATSAELQTLSGVGEATAAAIIEDRESNGPFTSADDLMRVPGIGEKKFAKIKDRVCV